VEVNDASALDFSFAVRRHEPGATLAMGVAFSKRSKQRIRFPPETFETVLEDIDCPAMTPVYS
jgi:hypothetical protein